MTQEQQDYITSIESKGGKLTPAQVVEAAKDEASPIHECFTWDDSVAAAAYRIEQARELIRRVRIEVVYEETTIRTVQYVRDQRCKDEEPGYVSLTKAAGNNAAMIVHAEWKAVLAHAERALAITQAKANSISNGDSIVEDALAVVEELKIMVG